MRIKQTWKWLLQFYKYRVTGWISNGLIFTRCDWMRNHMRVERKSPMSINRIIERQQLETHPHKLVNFWPGALIFHRAKHLEFSPLAGSNFAPLAKRPPVSTHTAAKAPTHMWQCETLGGAWKLSMREFGTADSWMHNRKWWNYGHLNCRVRSGVGRAAD